MQEKIQQIAQALYQAEHNCQPIPPISPEIGGHNVEAAYAIQACNVRRAIQEGRRPVGRKIGLTSPAVQKQLGVDQPDFGRLFADMSFADGQEVPVHRLIQPKCEAEIALVLKHDLNQGTDITLTELINAIDYLLPAIEIVDSRIQDWKIGIADTIADNASSALFVLGNRPVCLSSVDLRLAGMVMNVNEEQASVGVGAACLGHPLNAALWLARKAVEVGEGLRAGEVILTGALGPMAVVKAGDTVTAHIQGVGSVTTYFSNGAM